MAVNSILRRASSFLGFGSQEMQKPSIKNDEVIYCKNNVCVHPPTPVRVEMDHHPGYLTIRSQHDEILGSTLILTWIPNSTLKKNPRSIENRTPMSSPCRSSLSSACTSPRNSPRHSSYSLHSEVFHSNCSSPRMSICSEPSPEDTSHIFLNSLHLDSDKKDTISISSTASEMGSPREDVQSLDSWSQSDASGYTVQSLSHKDILVSQSNSGVGPEDVSAALESMMNSLHEKSNNGSPLQKIKNREKTCSTDSVDCDNEACQSRSGSLLSAERMFGSKIEKNKICESNENSSDSCTSAFHFELEGENLRIMSEVENNESSECQSRLVLNEVPYRNHHENVKKILLKVADINGRSSLCCRRRDIKLHLKEGNFDEVFEELKVTETVKRMCPNAEEQHDPRNILNKQSCDQRSQLKLCLDQIRREDEFLSDFHQKSHNSNSATVSSQDLKSFLTSSPGSKLLPRSPSSQEPTETKRRSYYLEGTPETLALAHNLIFPDSISHSNAPSPSRREHQCGIFSVDLGQMRSLRMFFSNRECTCGQLVIASRESQYKILHFHNGGLDKLASIFEEWHVLTKPKIKSENCPYQQFSVCRPEVRQEECHPEEGIYSIVDENIWSSFLNDEGQIEDDIHLRKAIFFAGLDPTIRKEAWPYLLHYYSFMSSAEEREETTRNRYVEYMDIRKKRKHMNEEEKEIFWRNIQCIVDKDVVRTDRSNPFFSGDDNPNVEMMRNILLNYAVYNPAMGYTQGMSDLLAPILAEIQNEVDTFWCFVGLMQRTIFFSSPKDKDMDRNLNYLRELIRLMVPAFYNHLQSIRDGMELLFCHRWILLCFKREFVEVEGLKMWEACWANYQTDYFHLFLCVAIIAIYGEDVIEQGLPSDEMLLHFSSLAMHMNGDLVLRKARGLLHQYRQMPQIPCTLNGLCEMCGSGMWDSGHVPILVCADNHGNLACPHGGQDPVNASN